MFVTKIQLYPNTTYSVVSSVSDTIERRILKGEVFCEVVLKGYRVLMFSPVDTNKVHSSSFNDLDVPLLQKVMVNWEEWAVAVRKQ